ncbi:MAG: hypothetical protein HY716_08925 [Planctomycetes bacterium]|nr:hypothetical protein [Planctomycetota bacterium]
MMTLRILVVAAAISTAVSARPQEQEAAGITWARSWEAAVREASVRNVPMYFTAHKDGCSGCRAMEGKTYKDASIIEASRNAVFIVGHWEDKHGNQERCRIYSTIRCREHADIARLKFTDFFGQRVFATPHHIWLHPDGQELFRKSGALSADAFKKLMEQAQAKVSGPRISKAEFGKIQKQFDDAENAVTQGEIRKAIETLNRLATHEAAAARRWAAEQLKQLDARGDRDVEYAKSKIEAGVEIEESKDLLKKIAEDYRPLECSRKAAEVLKSLQ